MATRVRKIKILLDDYQYRMLLALARAEKRSLRQLIQEAVVEQLLKKARRTAKQKAFEEIAAMDLPVGEWSEMEKGIERIHRGHRRRQKP